MKKGFYITAAYALIVICGGLVGCFIAGSIPSLIAGLAFGGLIALNAYKIYKGNVKGMSLALIQSLILGSFFIYRLKVSGKFMPAGMMVIISFTVTILLLILHPKEQKQI